MRGRKPIPAAVQLAKGDPRKIGKRKLQEQVDAEPQTQRGYPPCPQHLQGIARTTWKFLAQQVASMGQDKKPDALMLEGVCVNYAMAVQADKIIARDGLTVEISKIDEESGEKIVLKIQKRPEVAISNQAWLRVRAFCSEFGLSPVSRTRLAAANATEEHDDEEMKRLLSAPRDRKFQPNQVN